MDLSAPASAVDPGKGAGEQPVGDASTQLVPETPQPSSLATPIPSGQGDRSPLPIDAPVPPSPAPPHDEVPPAVAHGLIPPAVSTPTVITTEDDAMLGSGTIESAESAPAPAVTGLTTESSRQPSTVPSTLAPTGGDQSPIPPAANPAPLPPISGSEQASASVSLSQPAAASSLSTAPSNAMDMDGEADAVGEDDDPSSLRAVDAALMAPQDGNSMSNLKRPGEELAGTEAKRQREQEAVAAPAPPAPTPAAQLPPAQQQQPPASDSAPPTTAPAPPAATPGAVETPVTFVPAHYVPPPPRDAGPTTPLTQNQHKHLLNAIRSLKKSKDAVNFLAPVDVVLFGIPHYVNIVKNPMDLGTVETKLIVSNPRGPPKDKSKMGNWDTSKGRYNSVSEVVQDVRQIWENTRMFNGADHVVSQMATRLEASFEKALATMPAEVSWNES